MAGYVAILFLLLQLFDWQPLAACRIASETISSETGYLHARLMSLELDPNIEVTLRVLLFSRFFSALVSSEFPDSFPRCWTGSIGCGSADWPPQSA